VRRQAQLLGLSRSSVYYRGRPVSARDLKLMRRIDELHLEAPFFGARKIAAQLRREGQLVGRRHVRTLMRKMGIQALYRRPRTSIPAREATIYPYLLENVVIERPNQVWSSDLTYLPMAHGFLYLMAILDIASRKVLAWRLSNTMEAGFCLEALEERSQQVRATGYFQHRSGIAIHQRGVDDTPEGGRCCDQHGWQGSLDRQHLHRAAVAQREVRRGLPACIRLGVRGTPISGAVLRLLQRTTRSRVPRRCHA